MTTAMTGHQPTPQLGVRADGSAGRKVFIPDLVRACGVRHLREIDPYDVEAFTAALKEADSFIRSPEGDIAVLIARHPCIVNREARNAQAVFAVSITDDCAGCRACIDAFECPAILFDREKNRAQIDKNRCIGCGVCRYVCPTGAILTEGGEP